MPKRPFKQARGRAGCGTGSSAPPQSWHFANVLIPPPTRDHASHGFQKYAETRRKSVEPGPLSKQRSSEACNKCE
jgi:hypothetical protein